MAVLTITASQVLPDTTYPIRSGVAAVAITPGQAVCYDPTTNTVKLYDADDSLVNTLQPGIAVNQAVAAGQMVQWQETAGASITLGAGAAPAVGTIYVGAATAGGIAPAADLTTAWMRSILGVGMSGNRLKLVAWNSGIVG